MLKVPQNEIPTPDPGELPEDRLRVRKRKSTDADLKDNEQDLEKLKDAKIPTRRVKMLMVNPADFLFLFTKGLEFRKHTKLLEGVPADAQLIAIAADSVRNGIMLVVQSASYAEVPINVLPPVEPISIDVGVKNATKKKKQPRKKR
jgi:hypothetical protein